MGKYLCGSAVQHLSMSLYIGRMFVFGLAEHQLSLSHHVHVHFHGMINVLLQDLLSENLFACSSSHAQEPEPEKKYF